LNSENHHITSHQLGYRFSRGYLLNLLRSEIKGGYIYHVLMIMTIVALSSCLVSNLFVCPIR